jgi:hypothetical protein
MNNDFFLNCLYYDIISTFKNCFIKYSEINKTIVELNNLLLNEHLNNYSKSILKLYYFQLYFLKLYFFYSSYK